MSSSAELESVAVKAATPTLCKTTHDVDIVVVRKYWCPGLTASTPPLDTTTRDVDIVVVVCSAELESVVVHSLFSIPLCLLGCQYGLVLGDIQGRFVLLL